MSPDDAKNESTLLETLTVTTFLAPLFYTAGWSYAYHYFERFNLGLMGLDIPGEYFFLYSYWAVKDQFGWFLLSLVLFVTVFFGGRFFLTRMSERAVRSNFSRILRLSPTVLVPLLILSMFYVFYLLGDRAADHAFEKQVQSDFPSYPRVQVWAEASKKDEYANERVKDWQKGCYRLLMRNNDHLFLFYPAQSQDKLPTDIIPSGKIEMVRMMPEYRSCP